MKKRLLPYILLFVAIALQAQTLDDAKKWYLEGNYEKAKPVFEAEYAQKSDDASLNQWLGVCAMHTSDWRAAEKHLTFAASKRIPEAFYHLGLLYARQYRFGDAETQFEKYRRAKRRDKEALAKLEQAKEYADDLKHFIRRTEDVQIIDSVVVAKDALLSAYRLSPSSGTLAPASALLGNDYIDHLPAFMNERKDKMYYSRTDSVNGSDLYSMEKLYDDFGNEKRLSVSVNDKSNQAYPFVMPDGLTLYFASSGDESVGGYDLFVTRYHLTTDSYLKPNHLNAPFNSPFNDYMMAIDEEKGIGWFASDRFQPADSVCVYTFIPNDEVRMLETDDEDYLIRRARIAQIRDSWKPDADYSSLLAKSTASFTENKTAKPDFQFVINDTYTYTQLNDFKSLTAKELFLKYQAAEADLQRTEEDLAMQRARYAQSGKSEQDNLKITLLTLEKTLEQLQLSKAQFAKEARNEEIRYNQWTQ